jgi:hypothetical protein
MLSNAPHPDLSVSPPQTALSHRRAAISCTKAWRSVSTSLEAHAEASTATTVKRDGAWDSRTKKGKEVMGGETPRARRIFIGDGHPPANSHAP